MQAKSTTQQLVPIDRILVGTRHRQADPQKVKALAESMRLVGLLNPITLTEQWRLVAGLHRLEAWASLKHTRIPAIVVSLDELHRDLAELDENLIRNDLTVLERGQLLRRRNALLAVLGQRAKSGGTGANQYTDTSRGDTVSPLLKTTAAIAADLGISERSAQRYTRIADKVAPDVQAALLADPLLCEVADSTTDLLLLARMDAAQQSAVVGKVLALAEAAKTDHTVAVTVKAAQRANLHEQQEARIANVASVPVGKYRCLVIDPPWPVDKILRDERPNQDVFDYPTMTVEAIIGLDVPSLADEDGCHIYLWFPHRFLPDALACFERWGARYECALTWVKPSGPTPFSWMYNTEGALFGRIGRSLPLQRMGLKLSFDAPTAGHSVKPASFYERVRAASPAPRLEMFARHSRDGFTPWGNEVTAETEVAP